MGAQIQLLLDAWVAGAQRVLDVEMLAADPLFVHLASQLPSDPGAHRSNWPAFQCDWTVQNQKAIGRLRPWRKP